MVTKIFIGKLFLIINILLYLITLLLWISIPDSLTLNFCVTGFTLGLTGILIFTYQEQFKIYYQSTYFKKLLEVILSSCLVFFILGLINYISFKHPYLKDFSLYQINSLTEQSRQVVRSFDKPVSFKLLARDQEAIQISPLLELYRMQNSKVEIENFDVDLRPDIVSQYQITKQPALVVEANNRSQVVYDFNELNITNALIKINRQSSPVIYYLDGHGGAMFDSQEAQGFSNLKELMKNAMFEIRPLNLLTQTEVPFDASLVIIWGARLPFQKFEIEALEKFMARTGRLMVAIDPEFNRPQVDNLREFLKKYRLEIRNDVVIDNAPGSFVNGSNGMAPVLNEYSSEHEITRNFKEQSFFPVTSSLHEFNTSSIEGKFTSLGQSSSAPASWGEVSFQEFVNKSIKYDLGKDNPGPLTLAATFENEKYKVVAFGNSTFVSNAYGKFSGNFTLFLNSLSWVADQGKLISFNLPVIQSEPVFISDYQQGIIFYFSVIFVPLLMFVLAVWVYRSRQKL